MEQKKQEEENTRKDGHSCSDLTEDGDECYFLLGGTQDLVR